MIRGASRACRALVLARRPREALQLAARPPHSPNTEDIQTAYWVMIVIGAGHRVADQRCADRAAGPLPRARGRGPAPFTAGRGAMRPRHGFLALALASSSSASSSPSTRAGSTTAGRGPRRRASAQRRGHRPDRLRRSRAATRGDRARGRSARQPSRPAGDPRDRPAMAVALRVPGRHPGASTFSYGELVVPVDTPSFLEINSTDVIHPWSVPALTGQVQAVPGTITQTWFKADEAGTSAGSSRSSTAPLMRPCAPRCASSSPRVRGLRRDRSRPDGARAVPRNGRRAAAQAQRQGRGR